MATPGRAYWKGFLRLSLVSIAVEIYNAVETASEIHFNQIHKPTGKRINYTKTVKGVGPVENADIVKGYEIDKDTYVTLEPEEIEAIGLESKKIVDLVQFVDASEIDPRYFERPYYIVPADDHAKEGYLVIREALAEDEEGRHRPDHHVRPRTSRGGESRRAGPGHGSDPLSERAEGDAGIISTI